MSGQWLMNPRIKTRIEAVVQELISTRGATQAQLTEFFGSREMRERMLGGFDNMMDRKKTPALRHLSEAETD